MIPQKEFWFRAGQLFVLCNLLIANGNFHYTSDILYSLSCARLYMHQGAENIPLFSYWPESRSAEKKIPTNRST